MFDNVWEPDVIVDGRTIDVHIAKIRKFIPSIPIVTKKRVGYAWIEENQDNG
jgi:DNA-binding response OmpR family regulator